MSPVPDAVLYLPLDPMIYKIRIGRQDFTKNTSGQFEIPQDLAAQADLQANIKRVIPKSPA